MNPTIICVLALVGMAAAGTAEWGNGWFRQEWYSLPSFSLALGTPQQRFISFYVDPFISSQGASRLQIGNIADKSGPYNTTASSTFKFLRPIYRRRDSFTASDTVQVRDGPKIEAAEIDVMSYSREVDVGYVDLNPGMKGERSFVANFLDNLGGDRTVVFDISEDKYTVEGNITFGNSKPKICSSDWNVYPARDQANYLFTFETDEVQIGKYTNSARVPLIFDSKDVYLDYDTYGAALKELNVQKGGRIQCTQDKEIVIRAGRLSWTLTRKDYLQSWPVGGCTFKILESTADVIRLPLSMMKGQCIRYDFDYETVSIAKRV